MMKKMSVDEREEMFMDNMDVWKNNPYAASYKVFRDLIAFDIYRNPEEFVNNLDEDSKGYMESLVRDAYKRLNVSYESPFKREDFDIRFYYDTNIYSVCIYIRNNEEYTDVLSLFFHFQIDEDEVVDECYYFTLPAENGDVECFCIYQSGYLDTAGTVSVEEEDQEFAEWECTQFDYILANNMQKGGIAL